MQMKKSGKVYHLNLNKDQIQGAKYVLLPGDPFRCEAIAKKLDIQSKQIAWKREYRTWLSKVNDKSILTTSTGIGGASTSIAIDELAQLGVKVFIRVGTTGAIRKKINIGDVIITSGAVRFDGTSTQYAPIEYPAVAHYRVINALVEAAHQQNVPYYVGIAASCATFYPGQERKESFLGFVPRRFQGLTDELRRLNVLCYEMEASVVLTLCSVMRLMGGCVLGVILNRYKHGEKIALEDLEKGEENATKVAVRAIKILLSSKNGD